MSGSQISTVAGPYAHRVARTLADYRDPNQFWDTLLPKPHHDMKSTRNFGNYPDF